MGGLFFSRNSTAEGGASVSGLAVSCFSSMENCLEACHMECYFTPNCNDQPGDFVACAPGTWTMIVLTVLFVLSLCCCCCAICFFSPCCICAVWCKKRRDRRNRAAAERTVPEPYPTASAPLYPPSPSIYPKV